MSYQDARLNGLASFLFFPMLTRDIKYVIIKFVREIFDYEKNAFYLQSQSRKGKSP